MPGRCGQSGLNVPPLSTKELHVPPEGVQRGGIEGVANQTFESGRSVMLRRSSHHSAPVRRASGVESEPGVHFGRMNSDAQSALGCRIPTEPELATMTPPMILWAQSIKRGHTPGTACSDGSNERVSPFWKQPRFREA